jgi:hypothetical protein
MSAKITNPTKPSECAAAMSLSEDDAEHPYASIFYTSHEGLITFFGLKVSGTRTVEEGALLVYGDDTDPDKASPIIVGTLEAGRMEIGDGRQRSSITLGGQDAATDFVSIIRMVYSMEAHGQAAE